MKTRVGELPRLERMKIYIQEELLPLVGRGIVSKKRLEDMLVEASKPEWLEHLSLRGRRQLMTKAMDLLGRRWSDGAWLVEPDPVPCKQDSRKRK